VMPRDQVRVAIYVRSRGNTHESRTSTQHQRDQLRAVLNAHDGWRLVRTFTDCGSANAVHRPGLTATLVQAGYLAQGPGRTSALARRPGDTWAARLLRAAATARLPADAEGAWTLHRAASDHSLGRPLDRGRGRPARPATAPRLRPGDARPAPLRALWPAPQRRRRGRRAGAWGRARATTTRSRRLIAPAQPARGRTSPRDPPAPFPEACELV